MSLTPYWNDFEIPKWNIFPNWKEWTLPNGVYDAYHALDVWTPPPQAPPALLGLAIVLIAVVAMAMIVRRRPVKLGEDKVAERLRNTKIKFELGAGLVDLIEDYVFKGKWTREEAQEVYLQFGKCFNIPDILPVKRLRVPPSREEVNKLKAVIKQRLVKTEKVQTDSITAPKLGSMLKRA